MISETAILKPSTDGEISLANDRSDHVLERAQAGDKIAFEDLMRRHERLVFGTARTVLGGAEEAEDAAQEVFLRLFRHLRRLDPARPLGAWLYRVTVNVCRTLGRRRRGRPTVPLADAEQIIAGGSIPEAAVELMEERRMMERGLDTLGKRERAALILHDVDGLSTREVAAAFGVSEVTVRTHLCRARLKMRAFRESWYQGETS